jgi:uncharacterized membrane protein
MADADRDPDRDRYRQHDRAAAPPAAVDLRRGLGIGMAVLAALTLLGLVALWPRGEAPEIGTFPRDYVDGTIEGAAADRTCSDIEIPGATANCVVYDVRLTSGPDDGEHVDLSVRASQLDVPQLAEGDAIVLRHFPDSPAEFRYAFDDYQRSTPLLWLLAGFVVVVLALGRLQGARALAGLALSLVVLVLFVVPALLRDTPAISVALVGCAAVAFLAIYLAHGVNIASSIALAGTLFSLALTALLAVTVAGATQLSGLASEEAQTLRITADALDLRGLLVAGIVIGALGVLDDVTVSQVSTVAALRRANPDLGLWPLYREAHRVGRDHVASAVNTLVLAYAGASLPLLLFFAQGDQPIARLVTGELVAVEIVRMLVGSIGLVIAVPVTTLLAAAVLVDAAPDELPADDGHGHGPGHAHGPVDHGRRRHLGPDATVPAPTERQDRAPEPWF